MDQSSDARFERFNEHLPKSDDYELIVLKGHLLVEEILENIIKSQCQAPDVLDSVEIGFFLKSRIARALIGGKFRNGLKLPETIWSKIDSLNSLRNELVHSLKDKEKIDSRVDKFILEVKNLVEEPMPEISRSRSLRRCISNILGYFAAIEATVIMNT